MKRRFRDIAERCANAHAYIRRGADDSRFAAYQRLERAFLGESCAA
jgi:hypothetical protein